MKRLLGVLLAFAITLGCTSCGAAQEEIQPSDAPQETASRYSDVPADAWCAPYVEFCAQQGLLKGVGDGRFSPDTVVNNDEAMVMAARALWQSDGGQGDLPQGLTPEALVELLGEDQRQLSHPPLEDAQRLSQLWPWDGFCYLVQRCPELDFQLPDYIFDTYPATRQEFFRLLALAGRDLPAINDVAAVPGCRDESILHLYRAGVLSGADGYGSFQPQRHLTRAEAAAALARLASPELRLKFDLEPSPWTSYTLTLLGPDKDSFGIHYPVLPMADGILTLDGDKVDYPPGQLIGGTSVGDCGEYLKLTPSTGSPDWKHYTALVDQKGELPFPVWTYDDLYPLSDGTFLTVQWEESSDYETREARWYILSADGQVIRQLPSTYGASDNNWYNYNEGLCPWRDEETNLMGYVDGDGAWVIPAQWTYAGPFSHGQAVVHSKDQRGVIDTSGATVMPLALRGELYQGYVSDGCNAPMRYRWENWPCRNDRDGWLDDQGKAVPGPKTDPDIGIHPYYQNGYFSDGQTYYDLSGQQCSETFDWCGPLTADGRGFVCLDGNIYRIEFQK